MGKREFGRVLCWVSQWGLASALGGRTLATGMLQHTNGPCAVFFCAWGLSSAFGRAGAKHPANKRMSSPKRC